MSPHIITLLAFAAQGLALADPLITAAAQLAPRATDPAFVGYISSGGSFISGRTCSYPQTLSTSGSYVQCCASTDPCVFFTSCSSNTLVASGTAVACDNDAASTCNTGIVLATTGASSGPSFLGCWQKTLGSSAFTFVQDIGGASVAADPTSASSSPRASSGAITTTSGASRTTSGASSNTSASRASSAATSTTSNAAVGVDAGLSGGLVGALAMLAQMLL